LRGFSHAGLGYSFFVDLEKVGLETTFYGSQRRWADALSGNQPFWQINFLLFFFKSLKHSN